ncbi:MAG: PglZ domain-containing protein [Chloroflexi bacterium]|nr:PglZ domain-containing protein [Chloroflexota bacterium]
MSIAGLAEQALVEELQRQGGAGLVVWYDQGGSLAAIVSNAVPNGVQFLKFQGSYLALRFALEKRDQGFRGRWVIYIPEAPPNPSWLRDWELLGVRWEMDLLELLRRKANLTITNRLTKLMRAIPQNDRDLVQGWQSLIGERAVSEETLVDAVLALGFGLPFWQIEQAILTFLDNAINRQQLDVRGVWPSFVERVGQWAGWAAPPADESALRKQLEAAVLLSELVTAIPALTDRFGSILPSQSNRTAAAALAKMWRDREDLRESYVRAAQRVEREYEVGKALTISDALLGVETLPLVDELWWRELKNAVASDGSNYQERVQKIRQIAERREKFFWARQGKASHWEPVALAAQLDVGCKEATRLSEHLSSTEQFVQHYVADQGWWQFDLWALSLAARMKTLRADDRTRLVYPSLRAYGEYLNLVNRRFDEVAQRDGWTPTQTDFWNRFATGRKMVVFLVDALRYDLANYLQDNLPRSDFDVTFNALRGVLPSVTEVGMSALLPGSKDGLSLAIDANRLKVFLGEEEIGTRSLRRARLEQRLAGRGKVLDLDEVEGSSLEAAEILVVLSREVDTYGTFAADLDPQGLMGMTEGVARAIVSLKDRGFERFVIGTDHGFLFLPPEVEPHKIGAPTAMLCKRRFAVGATQEGCIVKTAEELGLRGPEVLAFPIGLTVFGLPGETGSFLHGGLSLQESIIPILEIKTIAPVGKVAVEIVSPNQLSSRIAIVKLHVSGPALLMQPRRIVVEINGKCSPILDLSLERPEATVNVTWLGFDETAPREATIRLLDADSQLPLDQRTVPVELVI